MTAARAVRPSPSLQGVLEVPSDKSIAHRVLLLEALANGSASVIVRSPGRDVRSTIDGLRSLGVRIAEDPVGETGEVRLTIHGIGTADGIGRFGDGEVDCGNSGTTMRLLAGAAAGGHGTVRLGGDASLQGRPMERVGAPLRAMGARVRTRDGKPPMEVAGRRPLVALRHRLPVPSAQVLGAVSIAALAAEGRTTIEVPGPTRDHTERLLAWLGAPVERVPLDGGGTLTTVDGPARLTARSIGIPGDPSSAAAWVVAAALHREAAVRLRDVSLNPTRLGFLDVLREMDACIDVEPRAEAPEKVGDLVVRGGRRLRSVRLAGARVAAVIDELPLLAVAMAGATGVSEVRDAGELRVKESDRWAAMAAALRTAGARVEELSDGWRIARGHATDGGTVTTHGDHRIAISMAVASWTGVAGRLTIDDPRSVEVSYPTFWSDAQRLGADA